MSAFVPLAVRVFPAIVKLGDPVVLRLVAVKLVLLKLVTLAV